MKTRTMFDSYILIIIAYKSSIPYYQESNIWSISNFLKNIIESIFADQYTLSEVYIAKIPGYNRVIYDTIMKNNS